MMVKHKFFTKYFKPNKFERLGKRSIYTWVGIKFFKKYLPSSGDLVRKKAPARFISYSKSDPFKSIYQYELRTRVYELRHLIGMLVFIVLAMLKQHYTMFDYVFVSVMFLVVNLYPIWLQRHNRIRILLLLDKYQQSSPYQTSGKDNL